MPLFTILLVVHVALAVGLLVPSFLLPFALRPRARPNAANAADDPQPGRVVAALLMLQGRGTLVIAAGLAVSGTGLLLMLGTYLLSQPWLAAALGLYGLNLGVALLLQRPGLRRLVGAQRDDATRSEPEPRWHTLSRRQRYISYLMAGSVGLIGFLMTSKPDLW